ncbi:MAG: N-acyl-D-amino-acid deacylase family protein [Fimbriimonadaceae bacterium]
MTLLASLVLTLVSGTTLIQGGTIVDGTGAPRIRADVRIEGRRIVAVGRLSPLPGESVVNAQGLVVAPGFIDSHSHADGGLLEGLPADSQLRQGITTAVAGQDGYWRGPVAQTMEQLSRQPLSLNVALFSGHGGIRRHVLGENFKREATSAELLALASLVEADMKAGALGLSTGLEYDPGFYSPTEEVVELAKVAGRAGGMYISHVRDEGHHAMKAFEEVVRIAREARLPGQISHIKLGVAPVWGKAREALGVIERARDQGLDITADVYPYTYWQSTITVLTLSKDWDNPQVWQDALADVGGPQNVLLSSYSPHPPWVGKTIAEIALSTGRTPTDIIMEIVRETRDGKGKESIVCTAMDERDVQEFVRHPWVMFCSDGAIGGSHPRGAGAFPRFFAEYVRRQPILSLEEAVFKATGLPAWRFGFTDRGRIAPGYRADIVLFDANRIQDRATTKNPRELSTGVVAVWVNGVPSLINGQATGKKGGEILRRDVRIGTLPLVRSRT